MQMQVHLLHIDPSSIQVDDARILSLLGEDREKPGVHTASLLYSLKQECLERCTPRAAMVFLPALRSHDNKAIAVENQLFHCGGTIARMMRGASAYAFFMATAGPQPEDLAREHLRAGNYLEAYLCDMIGSALADAAAEYCHEHIRSRVLREGMKVTNRYSPGYCGWKVSEQHKLFSLFPENCCGIRLTDSSLMLPIKSVSAVAGVGQNVQYRGYNCELCSMEDCIYRISRPGS